jgi:DNA-binding transcriptional LysR family regulator
MMNHYPKSGDNAEMPIDSLPDLATLVAVVEAQSFTAAARRQGVTVNAVSRRLQQLEQAVGVKLVERTTRRSAPTEAGLRLYRKAVLIFDELLQAEAEVQRAHTEVEGEVRLALPAAVVTRGLLARFERMLAKHPRLRLDVRVGSAHLPGEGGIDIALCTERPPESLALVSRKLGVHGWGLAASPSYVKTHGQPRLPADLSLHACLRFRGDVPQTTWYLSGARGKQLAVKIGGAFECDDSRVLGDATYAGLGIGVRPKEELADAVRRKALVHVLPGWTFGERPAYLLTTVGRRGLPRVRAVSEAIEAAVRALC